MSDTITLGDLIASRTEIKEVVKELSEDVKAGFERTDEQFVLVNQHFERINGRLRTAELGSAQHDVQLKHLEREVFDRGKAHLSLVPPSPAKMEDENKPITRREVWLAGAAFGAGIAFQVAPWLWKMLRP